MTDIEAKQKSIKQKIGDLEWSYGIAKPHSYQSFNATVSSLELPVNLTSLTDRYFQREAIVTGIALGDPIQLRMYLTRAYVSIVSADSEHIHQAFQKNQHGLYFLLNRPPQSLRIPGGNFRLPTFAGLFQFSESHEQTQLVPLAEVGFEHFQELEDLTTHLSGFEPTRFLRMM